MIQALRSSCSGLLHVLLSSGLLTDIYPATKDMGQYSKNVPEGYAIWINAECLSEDGVEQFEYSTMNLSSETRIRQGRRVSRVGDVSVTCPRIPI